MSKSCYPSEVALKAFFLGPQAENGDWVQSQVQFILKEWYQWRREAFPQDGHAISGEDIHVEEFLQRRKDCEKLLKELLDRFHEELPQFSPRYIGHMLSEISLPALLGHLISLIHNPNNVSGESSRVGIIIEDEAIQFLKKMVRFPDSSTGHFTSGGTVANFEAMTRAIERCNQWLHIGYAVRELKLEKMDLWQAAHLGWDRAEKYSRIPEVQKILHESAKEWSNPLLRAQMIGKCFGCRYAGPVLLVPEHKHYSWVKGADIFGLGEESLWPIQLSSTGHLDPQSLKQLLLKAKSENRPVALVVAVAGTTELGFIDPVDEVSQVLLTETKAGHHIWFHIDAAYGGFFCSMSEMGILGPRAEKAFLAFSQADSLTLDPHKLGYVPYASGTFLCKTEQDYYLKSYSGPYLQMKTSRVKGPFTLEGSRSAAGAVATWLTAKSIGLNNEGYGRILSRTIRSKRDLEVLLLETDDRFCIAPNADTNILGLVVADKNDTYFEASKKTQTLIDKISNSAHKEFFISKTKLTTKSYSKYLRHFGEEWNAQGELCDLDVLRVCIMNPFFDSKELSTNFKEEFCKYIKSQL